MEEYVVIINIRGGKMLDLFRDKLRRMIIRLTGNKNPRADKRLRINTIMSAEEYNKRMKER